MSFVQSSSYQGQPILVTEYGGIAFAGTNKKYWDYFRSVKREDEFFNRFRSITEAIQKIDYVVGYCYASLTGAMQEVNGLMSTDRKLNVNMKMDREINEKIKRIYNSF